MNLYAWLIASGVALFCALVAVNDRKYGWFLFFLLLSLFAILRPLWVWFL